MELMGESWMTEVREPLVREEFELMQGEEKDRQRKGQEVVIG